MRKDHGHGAEAHANGANTDPGQRQGPAAPEPARTQSHDPDGHDHPGHDHRGHDHPGHDHPGHDHAGNDPAQHAHAGHDHSHYRDIGRKRLVVVLSLTAGFMVVEFIGGWIANSLALMADAGHMLSDAGALALSLAALTFARRPATPEKSFGWFRIEILAALANGVALGAIAIAILTHAFQRLRAPEPVDATLMIAIASVGLLVNVIAALMLRGASAHNLNVRGAYLHVLGDLVGSVGAILAAAIILVTGWLPADPIVSGVVACLILFGSWRLIRESVDILLEAVPKHIDLDRIRATMRGIPGVQDVRDLHVWTLTSGYLAMSGHAAIDDLSTHADVLQRIHDCMHQDFGIDHVTIQLESPAVYQLGASAGGHEGPRPSTGPTPSDQP